MNVNTSRKLRKLLAFLIVFGMIIVPSAEGIAATNSVELQGDNVDDSNIAVSEDCLDITADEGVDNDGFAEMDYICGDEQDITDEDVTYEEEVIDVDPGEELDNPTAEKIEEFIKEYEEQLVFSDDEIVTDEVDTKYFEEKYGEEFIGMVDDGIDAVNDLADQGEIEITENGTIYDADDTDMYIQGKVNINKATTYWWGRMIYKSYSNANKMRKSMLASASRTGLMSTICGLGSLKIKKGKLGGFSVAFGALSVYAGRVATSIEKYNKKGKGIKYKIYWSMDYTMRTQGKAW